jgi:hypothetical protein
MPNSFDFNFRPVSYFHNLNLEEKLESKIKGQIRGQLVSKNIHDGFVPPQLLNSEISDPLRMAQGALHPWMMGGEYLPSLLENEVEICRVVLKSTTMDVFSLRAQQHSELLKYRVVDEYGEADYLLPITESKTPLSMEDLIKNLNLCKEIHRDTGEENTYGGGGLVRSWVFQQFEFGDSEQEASNFVTVHSAFYKEIEDYYEEQKLIWYQEMKGGMDN